ncbi:hypothetical protein [Blastomonas sp.]|uniref:hypothetical protein n=1 Tax=Blastomonas sp. TaxID=1909299 RepID=UPI0035937F38
MTMDLLSASLLAVALIHAPLAQRAQLIAVSNCNGGKSLLVIPGDDKAPRQNSGDDCAKACHAMNERRGKSAGKKMTGCG